MTPDEFTQVIRRLEHLQQTKPELLEAAGFATAIVLDLLLQALRTAEAGLREEGEHEAADFGARHLAEFETLANLTDLDLLPLILDKVGEPSVDGPE